jgi:hypothetical protein
MKGPDLRLEREMYLAQLNATLPKLNDLKAATAASLEKFYEQIAAWKNSLKQTKFGLFVYDPGKVADLMADTDPDKLNKIKTQEYIEFSSIWKVK